MTPDQVRNAIRGSYLQMMERVRRKEINESCVYGIIESQAREGARHGGVPESWRSLMPTELAINCRELV